MQNFVSSAYAPNIYKVSLTTCGTTSKFLIQKEEKKKPLPTRILQLRESWTRLERTHDRVTENLNCDPNLKDQLKCQFSFIWSSLPIIAEMVGGKNIVPVFLGWEIEKI